MGVSDFSNNISGGNSNGGGGIPMVAHPSMQSPAFDPEEFMVNMNKKKHAPTLFRDAIINQLITVLISESKANALLIGAAGTGKTNIVEELAARIERDAATKYQNSSIPPALHNTTIWSLQTSDIVAGAGLLGMLEDNINKIIAFLQDPKNKAIVFIDELHTLFSSSTYKGIAQILKPALSRGRIKLIGATTTQEAKDIETDPAFNRRLTKVIVDELTKEQTVEILEAYAGTLRSHYNTPFNFDKELAMTIVNIADDFCSAGSHRPDNALTLFDRSVASAIVQKSEMLASPDPNVVQMAKAVTGVALSENGIKRTAYRLTTGNHELKPFDETEMRTAFAPIKGQDNIIDNLIRAIKRRELYNRPTHTPMTFLFAGASGVGKTEITKILASNYVGEKPIMLNMAEFHSSASINRIIGAPAGYVGYDDKSELPFDILDTNPYQVILLDEFEKCNRGVQRLFMEVFNEGTLKTNYGKTIDFSKAIIIATTNAGCTNHSNALGFGASASHEKSIDDLSDYFDVELLNRFNYRFTFNDISKEMFRTIMRETYEAEAARIRQLKPRAAIPDMTDEDLDNLVEEHYNAKLGARPIATAVMDFIDNQMI